MNNTYIKTLENYFEADIATEHSLCGTRFFAGDLCWHDPEAGTFHAVDASYDADQGCYL